MPECILVFFFVRVVDRTRKVTDKTLKLKDRKHDVTDKTLEIIDSAQKC